MEMPFAVSVLSCLAPLYCIAVHDCLMLIEQINDEIESVKIVMLGQLLYPNILNHIFKFSG